ncbi:UNVERIFIED_CONTAM: hypothetical protein Scaly_2502400 [Sesamum calycinum]|uniref:Reverse transcriptase zinc-binding domain-containing protein n=1 Tax=Sesamum calycinum TaxID=2727403 RepID=A0AAW2LUB8_9LAMI
MSGPDDIALGTDCLRWLVDASMAGDLLQPYTAEEVSKALFQMVPLKSPGSDSMWLITDNILLAFELNHFLNSKSKGRPSWMAFKLNVSKAYDKILMAEQKSRFQGMLVCQAVPSISHLLFANGQHLEMGFRWNAKLLSRVGGEVLIKSILQAVHTYVMSCFRLPLSLLREIQSMLANFWLNNESHKTKFTGSCGKDFERAVCPFCGNGFEDVIHVLLCCPFAHQVWGMVPLVANFGSCDKKGVLLWMQIVASQLDAKSFGLFTFVCWAIWWFCIHYAMEEEGVEPVQAATYASRFLDSFLHQVAGSLLQPSSDSQGQCLVWMAQRVPRVGGVELTEAWAAREPIQFALQ